MLEPQAENPKALLKHHRRLAILNVDSGDLKAAYWHGCQVQKQIRLMMEGGR